MDWTEIVPNLEEGDGPPFVPVSVSSVALAKALTVKSGAGLLFGFTLFSSNVAAQFIQLHDATAVPANGAVPVAVFTVATVANLGVSYMPCGRLFREGIIIVNSTTSSTLTIGAADCFFDAQYL